LNPTEPGTFIAAAGVREGDVLDGKYRIDKILGVGGMGVVVAAHNVALDTRVALKFLLPEMVANRDAMARFAREARAAAKIVSEHVARVHDVGTLENGSPYIVMEFLEGEDLAAWSASRGPLPAEQAVDFLLQACVAIADAHRFGIVHRDLKPSNLFCAQRSDGRTSIKVLDFGISKLTDLSRASDPPGATVTRTSAVMGSPHYMSPEQVQSPKDVDGRTDIWAMGVILFELLTGTRPFEGETFGEIAVKISVRPHPSVRALCPDAPPAVEEVIARCLEKDREKRYANVGELAMALSPFAPPSAAATVERITGIVRGAGMAVSSPPPAREPRLVSTPPPREMPAGTALFPSSVAPWSGPPGVKSGRRAAIGVSAAAAIVAVVAGLFGLRATKQVHIDGGSTSAAAVAPANDPSSSTLVPQGAPTETAPEVLTPTPTLTEPAAASASTAPADAPPNHTSEGRTSRQVTAQPATETATPARSRPNATPKPDCDPPYRLDALGQKHFKPECYR
jgi:serine/threonine-protein kinase